jgi:twitching motility two-component system response regulator PilG
VLGLSESERRVLTSISWLSQSRPRGYEFQDLGAAAEYQIYLVDGDNEAALREWQRAYAAQPAPSVALASREIPGARTLKRPMGSRLLAMLDEVTVQQLHYMPELHIGGADAPLAVRPEARPTRRAEYRALIVDDSPTVRRQIALSLNAFDVASDAAENGEEALRRVARQRYDIVFLDVVMPGMDGYQVCKQIKKDPETKRIPVIMLTGKSSPFDRVRGSLAGCDTYLTKPVENARFQEVVKKYLGPVGAERRDLAEFGHPA